MTTKNNNNAAPVFKWRARLLLPLWCWLVVDDELLLNNHKAHDNADPEQAPAQNEANDLLSSQVQVGMSADAKEETTPRHDEKPPSRVQRQQVLTPEEDTTSRVEATEETSDPASPSGLRGVGRKHPEGNDRPASSTESEGNTSKINGTSFSRRQQDNATAETPGRDRSIVEESPQRESACYCYTGIPSYRSRRICLQ
ncbi:unknown protein [Seminavis robusta]|uniref:Uncharacterized protein n=1 Tax=Seminavis robusta TaxID=568900 RepID=A0A9N8HXJ9_9STRA|nr:unknown protein [Seminavis robusta]|eukprot:Sro2519_g330130.1 n/a (198) ;mRNA; f:12993-13704